MNWIEIKVDRIKSRSD